MAASRHIMESLHDPMCKNGKNMPRIGLAADKNVNEKKYCRPFSENVSCKKV